MSRGIGARQAAILAALERHGPLLGIALTAAVWDIVHQDSASTIPVSFYESTRRAAAGLVKRGRVLSGKPLYKMRDRHHPAKAVYWLPGQQPPPLDGDRW